MGIRIRRRVKAHNEEDYVDLKYKNRYDRGYSLKERKIKEDYDLSKVEVYNSEEKNENSVFLNKYEPEISYPSDDKLEILLLSKWLTYSSGFVLPTTFLSFCNSLKDGVVLSKLLYNYFLLAEDESYNEYLVLIKSNLILNPTTEREKDFNFSLFLESCKRLGIDTFNSLKRSFFLEPAKYNHIIVARLFLLEEFLFESNLEQDIRDDKQDFVILRKVNVIQNQRREQQKKRLTSYYLLAIKHRKRLLTEKLARLQEIQAEVEEEEDIRNETYLDISGKIKPTKEFWDLKYDSDSEDDTGDEDETGDMKLLRDIQEILESQRESSAEVEEIPVTQSVTSNDCYRASVSDNEHESVEVEEAEVEDEDDESILDENLDPGQRTSSGKEHDDTRSEVFYVIDEGDKDDEEISLNAKLDLLLDSPISLENVENAQQVSGKDVSERISDRQSVRSSKSTKTVVYYVIDELNEVDKNLSDLQNNIIQRFDQLKAKDRIVRCLNIFGREQERKQIEDLKQIPGLDYPLETLDTTLVQQEQQLSEAEEEENESDDEIKRSDD